MAEPCSTARRKERSAPSMTAAMDNEEATGGLDRRGSKLEVVKHPSQGVLGLAIEEHEQYEATDVQIWKNSSTVIHAATRATDV